MNELTNASPVLRGARRARLLHSARVAAPAAKGKRLDRVVITMLFALVGSALTAPLGAGAIMSWLRPQEPAPWSAIQFDAHPTVALARAW